MSFLSEIPLGWLDPALLAHSRRRLAHLTGDTGSPLFLHERKGGRLFRRILTLFSGTPEDMAAFRALVLERYKENAKPLPPPGEPAWLSVASGQAVSCKRHLRLDLLLRGESEELGAIQESCKLVLTDAGEIQLHCSGPLLVTLGAGMMLLLHLNQYDDAMSLGLPTWSAAYRALHEEHQQGTLRSWAHESEVVGGQGCAVRHVLRYGVQGVDVEMAGDEFLWMPNSEQQHRVTVELDLEQDLEWYCRLHSQWLAPAELEDPGTLTPTAAAAVGGSEEEEDEDSDEDGVEGLWAESSWAGTSTVFQWAQQAQEAQPEEDVGETSAQASGALPFRTSLDMLRTGETTVHTTAWSEDDLQKVDLYVTTILSVLMHTPSSRVAWHQRQENRRQRLVYGMAQPDVNKFLDKLPSEHVPTPFYFPPTK